MADWIGVDVGKPTTCGHEPHCSKGLCRKCYNAAYYERTAEKQREAARQWREDNPERKREQGREWHERNREANLEAARARYQANVEERREYARAQAAADRPGAQARAQAWRAANPERAKETTRRWREAHPAEFDAVRAAYRARKSTQKVHLPAEHWRMLLEQFNHACFYCGRGDLPLVQEHMTPLVRGGAHTASNLVPACRPCNGRKYTKTAEEFLGLA